MKTMANCVLEHIRVLARCVDSATQIGENRSRFGDLFSVYDYSVGG